MTGAPTGDTPPQREVLSRAHQLVIWLSLDSLEPYWLTLPPVSTHLPAIRAAAQSALRGWHAHNGTDAPEDWLFASLAASAPSETATALRGFLNAVLRLQSSPDLGYWQSWVGQNQHRPQVPGMAPDAAHALMKIYRDDVVTKGDAKWAEVRAAIKAMPLSDWDLGIHTDYGYCTEETDQFAESTLLAGLGRLKSDLLFNSFLARHVLTLPPHDQASLLAAVRAEWADLWSDDDSALGALLPATQHSPADADRIKPASEVVVWS